MKLVIDYPNQTIRIGSEEKNYFYAQHHNFADFMEEYTKLLFNMRKYFIINEFVYADLIGQLLIASDSYFPHAPSIISIYNFIEILDSINNCDDLEVEIKDFYPEAFKKCLNIVKERKGWKIKIKKEEYVKKKFPLLFKNHFLVRNALKARLFLRYILGKARCFGGRKKFKKADVLFLSNMMFSGGDGEKNNFFGSLVNCLNEMKVSNKILLYEPIDRMIDLKVVKKAFKTKDAYIGDYYSISHLHKCRNEYLLLRRRWEELKNDEEFKKIFVYKDYNFYEVIRPKLELVFNALIYLACDNKIITERIINCEGFKVLCVEHEENAYAKGFILNLRKTKEPKVVSLSHEIISDETIHLHFKNKEVLNRNSLLWRPLPDKKLVWGEYAKSKLVEKCNYPGSIIRVSGYPKFDAVFRKKYDKEVILKKIGLSKKRKKVFLAEQTNIDVSLPKFYMELARENPDIDFIIKPHPSEEMNDVHNRFSGKPNNLYLLDKAFNIYEVISISDYVVIRITTAGFEAMLMGKIVFVFNPRKEHLPGLPYVESEAAIEIHSCREFKNELRKLKKPSYYNKRMRKIKNFVNILYYKNDGRASERVVNEIVEYLR